jgi:hypothetical protein
VRCAHCGNAIAVSRWDRLNGFLVECPECHGFYGRRWNIRGLALASFLLNALSFFFTMRPGKAIAAIAAWVLTFWLMLTPSSDLRARCRLVHLDGAAAL